MTPSVFVINVEPPEIRVAEIRAGKLFDLDIERDARLLGNIYKGRVENIVPGMDAAFVNIGEKRNALLYVGDVLGSENGQSINRLLKARDEILVQVARPPVGTKGARVTMRLSLAGRFAILVTGSETTGVSKRIDSNEERNRLRRIADRLRPLDRGLILRTEAERASEPQISADLELLEQTLREIKSQGQTISAPALLHEDLGLLGRVARDRISKDVSAIYIDSAPLKEAFVNQLRVFAPDLARLVHLYHDPAPIFQKFGVARDVEHAGQRSVELPGGGSIVLDEAEALTAIDVNTGSHVGRKNLSETVVATNLEAVKEIARQLRLRDIGGIVVVDFIDMDRTRDRIKVLDELEKAVKDDRNRTRIVQISPSGLVEMTRRRENQTLRGLLNAPCPTCHGLGLVLRVTTLAIEGRRRARELALRHPQSEILAVLHPEIALEFLGEEAEWIGNLEEETQTQIWLRVDESLEREHLQFERLGAHSPRPRRLEVGSLVPFPTKARFYPQNAPHFGVSNGQLVHLDSVPEAPEKAEASQTAVVKIWESTRHLARGKIIAAP